MLATRPGSHSTGDITKSWMSEIGLCNNPSLISLSRFCFTHFRTFDSFQPDLNSTHDQKTKKTSSNCSSEFGCFLSNLCFSLSPLLVWGLRHPSTRCRPFAPRTKSPTGSIRWLSACTGTSARSNDTWTNFPIWLVCLTPFFDQNLERNNEIRVAHLQVLTRRPTIPSTRWIDQTRSTVRMGPITDRIYQHHKRLDATKKKKEKFKTEDVIHNNALCTTRKLSRIAEKKAEKKKRFLFYFLFLENEIIFWGLHFFFFLWAFWSSLMKSWFFPIIDETCVFFSLPFI